MVDESAPGSVNFAGRALGPVPYFLSDRFCARAHDANAKPMLANRNVRNERVFSIRHPLTTRCRPPRVAIAPSTECPRLMALRAAVASAAVGRGAGRRRHRLGAFRRGPANCEAKFHPQCECRNLRQNQRRPRLTPVGQRSRFAPAPRTERPRLMASRPAPAPAEVVRKTGRRRHRLGVLRGETLVLPRAPSFTALA